MNRIARILLRLYSREFRRKYGDDTLRVLRADVDDARARGGLARLFGPPWLLADFAAQGLLERWTRLLRLVSVPDGSVLNGLGQDARLAVRGVVKRPGFVLVAVTSLAIGVGANTVVFAVVDTLLLRDIPGVAEPDRVVELEMLRANGGVLSWDLPDFLDVRSQVGLLDDAAMFEFGPMSLSDQGGGERLNALYVTSGYFEALGLQLPRGRTFRSEEDVGPGEHPVVILSYATWRTRFHADPEILGRTVRLNRETYTVIGIAPEDFRGHQFGVRPAVYVPLTQYQPLRDNPAVFYESRGTHWGNVVARMGPDVELQALNAALAATMAGLGEAYPETNDGRMARAVAGGLAPARARAPMAVVFGMLGALMLLVLAATCANVGGMLLARASAQERDMAVRLALGSGRVRLVRLLLLEAMVIFVAGGAGGVYLATQGLRVFDPNRFLPTPFPMSFDFVLDWRVLAFGLVLTLGTGVVFGLMPALQVTRDNLAGALRDQAAGNGLRASRLRRVFVGGQVAVSYLLLASAALFLRSLEATDRDPAFAPEGVYVTPLDLTMEGYGDPAEADVFVRRLLAQLRSRPDVANATVATDFPLDGGSSSMPVWPDGRGPDDEGWIQSYFGRVTEGYFETLGIPVLAGRTFSAQDGRVTPRVALINELYAETAWPGENPLGRTVEFGPKGTVYTVIGMVANTNSDLVTDQPSPQVFSLLAQDFGSTVSVAVREVGTSPDFVAEIRREILQVDPALALGLTRSLQDLADFGTLPQRMAAGIGAITGLLALFLSAVGLYGVVAFAVGQRTREIGVRIALGATRRQVLAGVLRGGMGLAWPGFVMGAVLAVGLGYVLRAALVGVRPLDLLAYGTVAAVLVAVLTVACLVPARRAAGVQPMEALRYD